MSETQAERVERFGQYLECALDPSGASSVIDELAETLSVVREQRDALAADTDPYSSDGPRVPCGDGRCYCGGCVL